MRWLFERQQLADGRFPQLPSQRSGRADTGGDQLDESSYPILMALQAGLDRDAALWPRIKKAADFVVSRGPSFGSERWGSRAASRRPRLLQRSLVSWRRHHRRPQRRRSIVAGLLRTADDFARTIKEWTVTTTGPYAPRYFIRLSRNGDPNAAESYNLGNGSITVDQREVIDAGFLELTRLGILPPDDRRARSLPSSTTSSR